MEERNYAIPTREYTIDKTTKVQREKIVNEALGLSLLDAPAPAPEDMALIQEYVDGKLEINEVLRLAIARYDRTAAA